MSNKNFDTYLDFGSSQIRATSFNKNDKDLNNLTESFCVSNLDMKKLDLSNADVLIEKFITDLEKKNDEHLNEINLMIDSPNVLSISLSVSKVYDQAILTKQQIEYLIQDAKQQIKSSYPDNEIVHIIIQNYQIDQIDFKSIPTDITCKKLSIDLLFVCFQKKFINTISSLFKKYNVSVKKLLFCSYAKFSTYIEQFIDEKKVVFIDIGYEKTSIFFFIEGNLNYFKIIPIGGNHITKDISKILKINKEKAEILKLNFDKPDFYLSSNNYSLDLIKKITFSRTEEILEISSKFLDELTTINDIRFVLTGNGAKILDNNFKENIQFSSKIDLLDEDSLQICKTGLNLTQGVNEQEVSIIPKRTIKRGLFERFFNLFQ
jgi:cell division protein FtsA